MLPTPDTSHVSYNTIYEPSEDSYLFLDTLSSPSESTWLRSRFSNPSPSPLLLEVGCGSGVCLAFLTANSHLILGRRDVLSLATDLNRDACIATQQTITRAVEERQNHTQIDNEEDTAQNKVKSISLSAITGDLYTPLRPGTVDILLFNPPYVPTEELPVHPPSTETDKELSRDAQFERDSYYLSLTYAGGREGMETTDRFLDSIPEVLDPTRGVAYVLLCAQNRPQEVKARIQAWEGGWRAETVGNSGVQAGWEKLVIVRIWRDV